ncbi:hypothetical protein U1Q18_028328 [Sarracenia purpurea var. burkii]
MGASLDVEAMWVFGAALYLQFLASVIDVSSWVGDFQLEYAFLEFFAIRCFDWGAVGWLSSVLVQLFCSLLEVKID